MDLQQLLEQLRATGAGVWLLNDAVPAVAYSLDGDEDADRGGVFISLSEYDAAFSDDPPQHELDLRDAQQVLVVRLPRRLLNADQGLVTLVPAAGYCRVCGCSKHNPCIDDDGGRRCAWSEPDLCTACVGRPVPKVHEVEQLPLIEPELPPVRPDVARLRELAREGLRDAAQYDDPEDRAERYSAALAEIEAALGECVRGGG